MYSHVFQFLIKGILALILRLHVLQDDDLLGLLGLLGGPNNFLKCILVGGPELMVQVHWVDRRLPVRGYRGIYRRGLKQS